MLYVNHFFGRNDAKAETPVLWPPHAKIDSLENTLMLGGIGGRRRRGRQRMRWLDGITDSMDVSEWTEWILFWVNSGSWWWTGRPGVLWFNGVAKSQTRLSDWTELRRIWSDPCLVLLLSVKTIVSHFYWTFFIYQVVLSPSLRGCISSYTSCTWVLKFYHGF